MKHEHFVILATFFVTAACTTAFWQFAHRAMATSIATGDVGDILTRAYVAPEVFDDSGRKATYLAIDDWLAQSRLRYGKLLSYKVTPVERDGTHYRVEVAIRWEKGVQRVQLIALPGNSFTHVIKLQESAFMSETKTR